MKPMPRRQAGFTITELMVVVAILAILAGFALPAMTEMIRTQKVRSAAYDLVADLTFARSQAITLGRNVIMTSASGTNWGDGWSLVDQNGVLLRTAGAFSTGIIFSGTVSTLTFDRTGHSNVGPLTRFTIMPNSGSPPDAQKRCIKLAPSGRPNSVTGPCTP
jgi:type IV fimbrial biogenesis protein FimT